MMYIEKEIQKVIQVKNVKQDFGHDLAGLYADLYLKGKKVGYHNNDGRGGETDYYFEEGKKAELVAALEGFDFRTLALNHLNDNPYKNDWVIQDVDDNFMFDMLVEGLVHLKQFKRLEGKNILVGNPKESEYRKVSWRGRKLNEIPLEVLQATVDGLKNQMDEYDKFLNTNLEKLGVIL